MSSAAGQIAQATCACGASMHPTSKVCRDCHYARFQNRTVDVVTSVRDLRRFWVKVDIDLSPGACWRWRSAKDQPGRRYGGFTMNRRHKQAHRLAYEALKGPIPEGLELDHLCRNPSCVNPAHLEPVTHAENGRRGTAGWNMLIRTHCPKGHPYDDENTMFTPCRPTSRLCRECRRQRWREWYARRKAKS